MSARTYNNLYVHTKTGKAVVTAYVYSYEGKAVVTTYMYSCKGKAVVTVKAIVTANAHD